MEYVQTTRKLRRQLRPSSRCGGSKKKQIEKCARGNDHNGFLNHSFQPFWGIAMQSIAKAEREFFNSLSNCCNCYGFEMPDVAALPFPLNLNAAFETIKEKCEAVNETCIIISDKKRKASIATAKLYNTKHTLYYIPVRPLWLSQQDDSKKPFFDLIVCVFRYLYKIVGMPYFRKSGYLANIYEIIEDWIDNDEEEDEYRGKQKAEMEDMQVGSDSLFPFINKGFKSAHLQKLLEQFEKSSCFDSEIYSACNGLLQLSIQYPKRSIKQHLNTILIGDEEYVYIEQYVSFYWSGNDELYECLFDMVNNELQEFGEMEEPMSLQIFDEKHKKSLYDFDFETRLFDCINNLTVQLNFYDEKYNEPVQ